MAIVDGSLQLGYKNTAWFTANASLVLLVGQIVYLEQTGTYKIGDGVTQLSALSFLGVSSYTLTTSEIGAVINSATSATPNDTDLVMSVDTSIAKKNTWTQIKAFLKTYFDTVYANITDLTGYVKKGTLTTNKIPKATSSDTIGDSSITDDGTTVTVASPNGVNKVEVSDSLVKMYYESVINGLRGYVESNDVKSKIFHDLLIQLNAPSVTKNGVEVATENYVDNLIAGLKFKLDVVAASIANVNISSAPSTLDGVTLTSGDRVLLKNQTTQSQNGCYIFNGTGSAMTRATDSDSGVKLVSATYPVSGGATNQDTWFTVTNDSITLGSTNIVITQTAGSGTYTVGSYLKLIGNVFDIDFTTFSTTQITEGTKLFFTDARVLTAPLTGFVSAAGTITAADTILSAINKLNGNVALKAATTYVDDLKANFINKKNSDTPHTGTTSPTVIHSFEITPGTCQANDVLKFYIRHLSTNNANTKTVKMWANTTNTISGATQLSNYAYTTNSGGVLPFKRSLIFKNSLTSQKMINTTISHANDDVSYPNNGDPSLALDFTASVWILIEVTLANAADTFTMNLFNCKIER